jgi:succinate dehydrogenase/fumarate reductase flavoprotein subunit
VSRVEFDSIGDWNARAPLLIIGAGAAGLCAALAAKEAGIEAVVIERDAVPSGSTALSAGLVPAAGTRFQRAKGVADSADQLAADIQRKAYGEAPAVAERLSLIIFQIEHHTPESRSNILFMETELGSHLQHTRVFG